VLKWPGQTVTLPPIDEKIVSSRALTGGDVKVEQTDKEIRVTMAGKDHDPFDTVIELKLDRAVSKLYIDRKTPSIFDGPGYGEVISTSATLEASSHSAEFDKPDDHASLFTGRNGGHAFHTAPAMNPWVVIDLGDVKTVKGLRITNRPGERRTAGLEALLSVDKSNWTPVWKAETADQVWEVPVTQYTAGAYVPGMAARYVKLQLRPTRELPLLLKQVEVFGEK
jgi:hypothetical protein